ncbi:hypothetical protein BKA93DRAFT_254069 [Sparassis latifolia]
MLHISPAWITCSSHLSTRHAKSYFRLRISCVQLHLHLVNVDDPHAIPHFMPRRCDPFSVRLCFFPTSTCSVYCILILLHIYSVHDIEAYTTGDLRDRSVSTTYSRFPDSRVHCCSCLTDTFEHLPMSEFCYIAGSSPESSVALPLAACAGANHGFLVSSQ